MVDAKNIVGRLIAYEQGALGQDQTVELFQDLVDTGLAWELQGSYGRTALHLAEAGEIVIPEQA
jgi:hypothetical protein